LVERQTRFVMLVNLSAGRGGSPNT